MALADDLAARLGDDAARAAEVAAAIVAARPPNLPPPDAALIDALVGRAESLDELAALALGDLYIAHHAERGHGAAIAAIARLLETLRAPLRRTGADDQQIGELLADLPSDLVAPRETAPPRIAGYTGRGPLGAWLRVIAVRALVERRRKTRPTTDEDDAIAELAAPELDPELALLRQQYAAEFRRAFAAAVATLAPADRVLLRQHHLDGLGIDRLAVIHGCHRATAARRLAAARQAVFDAVRRRLQSELRIGGQTFDSLLRVVQSELELSLVRYL